MPDKKREQEMEGQGLLARFNQSRKSEIIIERDDEKIDVEIREIIRVRPSDFGALKNSFEEWAHTWE